METYPFGTNNSKADFFTLPGRQRSEWSGQKNEKMQNK